jgi:sugar-specific transcriptional regulator TrmB
MEEAEAVESLGRLGLSAYEAKVFIALQSLGTATASDIDRVADVPRSQVYGAAERLEERGLVEVQQADPIRYRPVGLEEARSRLRSRLERETKQAFDYLEHARDQREQEEREQEGVWTVQGRETISARVLDLIEEADERIVFASEPDLLDDPIVDALRAAAREVSVVVVTHVDAVAETFADDEHVTVRRVPKALDTEDRAGRLLVADRDTVLLSVFGQSSMFPQTVEETAIWSAETGLAAVLIQLLDSWLGDLVEV